MNSNKSFILCVLCNHVIQQNSIWLGFFVHNTLLVFTCVLIAFGFCFQACPAGQVPNSGQTACENCTAGNYRGSSDASCLPCPTGENFGTKRRQQWINGCTSIDNDKCISNALNPFMIYIYCMRLKTINVLTDVLVLCIPSLQVWGSKHSFTYWCVSTMYSQFLSDFAFIVSAAV